MTYWLSYGGGVNSTALGVMLAEGMLPALTPWRCVWADTGDEEEETYNYVERVWIPYLARHGLELETVRDKESVLERWQRLGVTGSRIIRSCTDHAKIQPIDRHKIAAGELSEVQLIGIDAGERHRVRPSRPCDPYPKRYPLVELGIDRAACVGIIRDVGRICVPPKSGCWHCPFRRKRQVIDLAKNRPDRMALIAELEAAATDLHPPAPGQRRTHFGDRTAEEWMALAAAEQAQGTLFDLGSDPDDAPCGCYDGGGAQ